MICLFEIPLSILQEKIKKLLRLTDKFQLTLTFTGDIAEIYVHNELDEGTSLHWHGLYLPNKEDGVPFLTQMPIAPNTLTNICPIIQNGTHWYPPAYKNKLGCMAP
jgi:hypothetical protein